MALLTTLCVLATAASPQRDFDTRFTTCLEVALTAEAAGFDPVLIVSLALEESNLRPDVVSKRGARGPLQALPAHWCPSGKAKGCDLVVAGLAAADAWRARKGSGWLCHYNAGNECGPRSHRYARRIERRAEHWRARLTRAAQER